MNDETRIRGMTADVPPPRPNPEASAPVEVSPATAPPATTAAPPATASRPPAEERIRSAIPGLDQMDAKQLAELAAGLDWQGIDLECPGGFAALIGAEPSDMHVLVVCDCGTKIRIHLDGEHMARCPSCSTVFRHVVVIQAEDADESGAALAVESILEANR